MDTEKTIGDLRRRRVREYSEGGGEGLHHILNKPTKGCPIFKPVMNPTSVIVRVGVWWENLGTGPPSSGSKRSSPILRTVDAATGESKSR